MILVVFSNLNDSMTVKCLLPQSWYLSGPVSSACCSCLHVGEYWCSAAMARTAYVARLLELRPVKCFTLMHYDQRIRNPPEGVTAYKSSLQSFQPPLRLLQHPKFSSALHPNTVWQTDTFPFLNLLKTAVVTVY